MSDPRPLNVVPDPQPRLRMEPADDVHVQPSSGYGSEGDVVGGQDVHLLDYVKILYKRRWMALTAFVLVVVSVSVQTFTAIPIYEARVEILIEKENTNVVTFKQAIEQQQSTDDY